MKLWPMRTAEPTTKPGLFCGWRLDAGRRYRDILQVLDYEAVRTRAHLHWFTNGRRSMKMEILYAPDWAYWVPFWAWVYGPSPSCRTPLILWKESVVIPQVIPTAVTFLSPIWRKNLVFERVTGSSQKDHQQTCQVQLFFPAQLFRNLVEFSVEMSFGFGLDCIRQSSTRNRDTRHACLGWWGH